MNSVSCSHMSSSGSRNGNGEKLLLYQTETDVWTRPTFRAKLGHRKGSLNATPRPHVSVSVLDIRPHVKGLLRHQKRRFPKTVPSVEIFLIHPLLVLLLSHSTDSIAVSLAFTSCHCNSSEFVWEIKITCYADQYWAMKNLVSLMASG